MLACGPFTVNNELSYEALKDLMQIVNRDKPHVLMLSGPFVSQNHEDISSGDLRYRNPEGDLLFMDTDYLFTQVMNYIYSQMTSLKNTQIVIVPST
jgi:DNA polymerase alpha subunit B